MEIKVKTELVDVRAIVDGLLTNELKELQGLAIAAKKYGEIEARYNADPQEEATQPLLDALGELIEAAGTYYQSTVTVPEETRVISLSGKAQDLGF